jgi:transcriptional regulator with AAA-type ATPase domain
MARAEDALELLLPDAEPPLMQRARDVTHFLRLLSDDAHSARAASVGIDWDRARTELEEHDVRRLVRALTDLMRHHLNAISAGDSFAWCGETALGVQAGWRLLEEFRDEMPWMAGVPEPGESPWRVAERLLESLVRLGISEAEAALWRARLARWSEGPRAAEKSFRTQLERAERESGDPLILRALVEGVAGCLLERGAVREARAWLLQHMAWVSRDARLRHLLAWTRLVLGDFTGAKSTLVGLRPWSGTLPRALFELRSHQREWLPCLAGRAPADELEIPGSPGAPGHIERDAGCLRSRAEVGAALLCVFEFRPGRSTHALVIDAAPALREGLESWMHDREDAWMNSSQLEHRMVVAARSIVVQREGEASLPGVLGRETTRALALVPILDSEGEVGGWLHMEFEHHLLPSAPRLGRMAQAWSAELVRLAALNQGATGPGPARRAAGLEPDSERCAEVFQRIVLELGIKTSQRRWWGFAVAARDVNQVATGGEGSILDTHRSGEQRALRRAALTGGTVLFDEPDPRLAIAPEAGSGVALPLLAAKRVCGVLAIESSRRRDFRSSDLERYARVLECGGLALRLAQFRTWHRVEFGFDLWFDAARPDFHNFAQTFLAAARSSSAVVLFGPAGTGKLILTRWLHFESAETPGPLKVFSCSRGLPRGGLFRILEDVGEGSLVLDDVEDLDPELQDELLRWLEGVDSASAHVRMDVTPKEAPGCAAKAVRSPRVFATTRLGLTEAARSGKLRHDLALRLNRLQLRVPALRERREDILPLIGCLARRFAEEEAVGVPVFTDEALALLWRQPWDGNVRELENVIYKLVLLPASEGRSSRTTIDTPHVARVAQTFELDLARKLNSRHPQRSDLLAALRATRMGAGRINKTRAALYMGWDPDTLVARMQDLGLQGVTELDPSAWLTQATEGAQVPSGTT